MMDGIPILISTLAVSAIIFLICREFMCWYFKINDRIKIKEETLKTLKNIEEELKSIRTNTRAKKEENKLNIRV